MSTSIDSVRITAAANRRTTNFLLACGCALLGLNLMASTFGIKFPPAAEAQTQSRGAGGDNVNDPPFNAGGQRKQIIDQLTILNEKVSRLEMRMEKGFSVKVTEMPPVTVKNPEK